MQFGPFCLIKVLVVSISFALAICFVGCGDDSSTGISNDTKIEADADDVSSSSKADEDEKISSSSMDDEDEEISSSTEGDEEDDEDDEEEAESSSSSKKSEKSSSSSKKKAKSSSSSAVVNKESSSSAGEEDPGVEPAEPESSPSSEGEYPDLSVLNDPNLKQGCDIDKNDNVWVIPSFGRRKDGLYLEGGYVFRFFGCRDRFGSPLVVPIRPRHGGLDPGRRRRPEKDLRWRGDARL